MRASRFSRSDVGTLSLFLLCGLLACVGRLSSLQEDVPPQSWWEERGPVVPHDGFPADCSLCHEGEGWDRIRDDFTFDHEAETGVPLEGLHARAECLRCHNDRGPVAVFAQRGCRGCHEDEHRGQLGYDCENCHDGSKASWRPNDTIAEHNRTRFPLVGAHAATPCWRCHVGAQVGNFTRVDVECLTCHMQDLAQATDPDHVAAGFTSDCDRCHIPTRWTGSGFSHPGIPLTGAHKAAACDACHAGGVFTGIPTDCFSCHMADYNGAPNHVAQAYPTDCDNCHNTTTWLGANFDHRGINTGCVNCHLAEYNNTNNPPHAGSGFGTDCENCHNTNSWFGANFNHRFPINGGPHASPGKLDCTECHTVPGNFMVFSCIDCHEHRQSKMDEEHDEVSGYVYQSSACYSCHPNGRE